jgi:protein-tyrosine phosphatase
MIIAYLMYDHAMGLDAAILLTRKARNSIYPNPGFKTQLQNYERSLREERYKQDQRARYKEDYTSMQ